MTRNCEQCGTRLERKPGESPAHYELRRFCTRTCGNEYRRKGPRRMHQGSGVVAGKIEIGRGARWGAGW